MTAIEAVSQHLELFTQLISCKQSLRMLGLPQRARVPECQRSLILSTLHPPRACDTQ